MRDRELADCEQADHTIPHIRATAWAGMTVEALEAHHRCPTAFIIDAAEPSERESASTGVADVSPSKNDGGY